MAQRAELLGVIALASMTMGCTYKTIPPGRVGIRVEMTGSDRGVQNIPLQTGRVWYNPINETVLDYPTFVQRAIWTHSSVEGSVNNDEISFQSRDALHFTADVAVSYQLLRDKVPHFYVQFRSDNISSFTHGFLRDAVRNAIGKIANEYTAEEINGIKQSEITEKALLVVSKKLEPIGLEIVQMGFTAPPRPPEEVAHAIKNKVAAIQRAEQAENERREAIAEGEKTVALAQATARANDVIHRSVTPQLMQWRQLDILNAKWDGKFPQVQTGNSNPMLMLQPRQDAGVKAAIYGIASDPQNKLAVISSIASTGPQSALVGIALEVIDPAELAKLKQVYFTAFPDGPSRESWPGIVYIAVKPTWIRFSDYGETPPTIEALSF